MKITQSEQSVKVALSQQEWEEIGTKAGWLKQADNKSGIEIKPSHEGKFTEYCGGKVTSKCIEKALKSDDPHVRQMANFARNAKKWD